jgi:uncharacterized protein YndB with AHSA1/START domain
VDSIRNGTACAIADAEHGQVLASVQIAVSPERLFRALTSEEITDWWVRPGVFDTREWTGNLRVGSRWRAAGVGRGQPYVQEGVFLEIDAPRRLVHTWDAVGTPDAPSTVTYLLDTREDGTCVTLRQAGFASREQCNAFAMGWKSSFERLAEILHDDAATMHTPT